MRCRSSKGCSALGRVIVAIVAALILVLAILKQCRARQAVAPFDSFNDRARAVCAQYLRVEGGTA